MNAKTIKIVLCCFVLWIPSTMFSQNIAELITSGKWKYQMVQMDSLKQEMSPEMRDENWFLFKTGGQVTESLNGEETTGLWTLNESTGEITIQGADETYSFTVAHITVAEMTIEGYTDEGNFVRMYLVKNP